MKAFGLPDGQKEFKNCDLVIVKNKKGVIVGHMWWVTAKNIYGDDKNYTFTYSEHNGEKNMRDWNNRVQS